MRILQTFDSNSDAAGDGGRKIVTFRKEIRGLQMDVTNC
jgi:hypothetical protein